MNNQIGYLIEEFIHKYNDNPNLILIPKDMYKSEYNVIKWKYAKLDNKTMNYTNVIVLDMIRCDYIKEIQVLKIIK